MRRTAVEPLLIAASLGIAYLIVAPSPPDLAAQVFRTELFEREGFTLWNGQWYGGHHTPGYSVLFPPLAALFGPRLVGVLTAVAAAVLFERIARDHFGVEKARIGAAWYGAATATDLLIGRLTFGLGAALALAAILAQQRGRPRLALAFAALTTLGSPVAGLFLALAALAWAAAERRRAGVGLAAAALAPALALAVLFPEGGEMPFSFSAFWPIIAFAVVALVLLPREERALRTGTVLYALAAIAAFAIASPMGGNANRLGSLFAGPVLACALWPHRRVALAAVAVPLVWWQWAPAVRETVKAVGDPAVNTAYFTPLIDFLDRTDSREGRIEIPFTRTHWEAARVAPHYQLARGWERQLDVKDNGLFYRGTLTPQRYRRWLDLYGVRYVALSDAKLDYSAKAEASLIRGGLPYLRPVWSNANWRVYRVSRPEPLATGAASLRDLDPDSFRLEATRAGEALVRVRFTPYWKITSGTGCISESPGGLTRVKLLRPGPVGVTASFALGRLLSRGPRCQLKA